MKHIENLLAVALGVGTLVGGVMMGCGGETPSASGGGNGASSAGGDGSGGNPSTSSSSSSSSGSGGMMAGSGGMAGFGGEAGSGGTAGSGGMAGFGGEAGSGGTGGSGGTAGSGGAGVCSTAADCNDGFNCTIDSCNAGMCGHVVGPNSGATACPAGKLCEVAQGCVGVTICANDATCIQKFGTDPCKSNIHCDLATATCAYSPLDQDNDGKPPVVCGGTDCDDSNNQTFPGAAEKCDGKDNNCNGTPDENATCSGLFVCQAGACACPPQYTCGAACVDKMTSNAHCGVCNNACLGATTCMNGQCVCPGGATSCSNVCVDIKTDPLHCGGCGKTCAAGYSCVNSLCTCLATPCGQNCVDTMNDSSNCGGCNVACMSGSTCSNGACVCPMGLSYCNGQCVDTKTNVNHCGMCNSTCNGICQNGMCQECSVANLYLFADNSGSLTEAAVGGTRDEVMDGGINLFMNDTLSANMGVGLGFHPVLGSSTTGVCFGINTPCTVDADCAFSPFPFCQAGTAVDSCVAADYTTPSVGIALLPGVQPAVTNSLSSHAPSGGSMPPPGLSGALQYAKAYAVSHATQKVAVVLFSDGFPNICTATTDVPTDLIPIVQQYANGSPKVVTYVIGIGDGISPNPTLSQWNQVASAGGTGTAQMANSMLSVANALRTIRNQFKTCP